MEIIRSNVRMLDKSNILTVLDLKKQLLSAAARSSWDSEVYVKTDFTGLSEDVLDNPLSANVSVFYTEQFRSALPME